VVAGALHPLGPGELPGGAKGVGLRLSPSFGHRFREVGEEHGEPEPDRQLKRESDIAATGDDVAQEGNRREHAANQHHEHHGVPCHVPKLELPERVPNGAANQRGLEQRTPDGGHG
jgi:hypothetical protein